MRARKTAGLRRIPFASTSLRSLAQLTAALHPVVPETVAKLRRPPTLLYLKLRRPRLRAALSEKNEARRGARECGGSAKQYSLSPWQRQQEKLPKGTTRF